MINAYPHLLIKLVEQQSFQCCQLHNGQNSKIAFVKKSHDLKSYLGDTNYLSSTFMIRFIVS